jgi:hypothetical protein
MLVWSQLGIVGYLIGPLAGGAAVDSLGFPALGLVPLAAAVLVGATFFTTARGERSLSS